jgi:hypothetical protein
MGKNSKSILGLKKRKRYSLSERHEIIQDYLSSEITKRLIWQKHTGYVSEHGQIIRWMRELGYSEKTKTSNCNFAVQKNEMSTKKNLQVHSDELLENLSLKKRILDLESKLKDAEMKAIAFSTMIEIAEKELKISIRKKFNTKPSKR